MEVTQYLEFLGTSEKVGNIIKDYTKSHFLTFSFISKHDSFLTWKGGKWVWEEKREACQ